MKTELEKCKCGEIQCANAECWHHAQGEGSLCPSCCEEFSIACTLRCPECGNVTIPDFPTDYVTRREREMDTGSYTPGYCPQHGTFP